MNDVVRVASLQLSESALLHSLGHKKLLEPKWSSAAENGGQKRFRTVQNASIVSRVKMELSFTKLTITLKTALLGEKQETTLGETRKVSKQTDPCVRLRSRLLMIENWNE